jgi:hypothetical protein
MKKRRGADLPVLAWWLGVVGAVTLMISTVQPASSVHSPFVVACALGGLGGVLYGLSRLWIRSSRHGSCEPVRLGDDGSRPGRS